MTDSQSGVKMKLIMTIFSVLTIGCTTILQVLIEAKKSEFELKNPPLLCPPSDLVISKEDAYLDQLSVHPKGLMPCFCYAMLRKGPLSIKAWKSPFTSFIDVDPHEEDTLQYCMKPAQTVVIRIFLRVFAACSIIIFNGIIAIVFRQLSKMQKMDTTIETTSKGYRQIFLMEFFNMSFSLLIASFLGLNSLFMSAGSNTIVPELKYFGFDTNWYYDVGNIIAMTVLAGGVISNGLDLKVYLKKAFQQLKDRKFSSNLKRLPQDEDDDEPNTKKVTQNDLEKMYEGDDFHCEKTISRMMSTTFVIFMFSPGMPILYFFGFLFFLGTYKTNKLLLMKYYKKTESILSRDIPVQAVYILRYALVIKLFAGITMYNNPKIFKTNSPPTGSLPGGFDIEGLAQNNPTLAAQLEKDPDMTEGSGEQYYLIDYIIMFHQQIYIMLAFGIILTKFSIDLCVYIWKIIYGSIYGMIMSIYIKLRYIFQFTAALIGSWVKRIKSFFKKIGRKMKAKKSNSSEHQQLTDEADKSLDKSKDQEASQRQKQSAQVSKENTPNDKRDMELAKRGDDVFSNSGSVQSGNQVDAMEEAGRLMAEKERQAYIDNIIKLRGERTDFSDNFLQELNMEYLDSIYERSKKEHQDFLAYFKINMATEKHMFNKKIKPSHKLREDFLEQCYLSGIVEDEVELYDNLLKKRIRDIEDVVDKHFATITGLILEEKEEKRDRDIEKTFKKEDYRQKIEQMIIEQKFNNDPDLKFDDPNIYTKEKKLEQLMAHQDALIRIDKERIENRRNIQTICRLQGSQAQSYFFFDCPKYKTAKRIYYQLEAEEQEIRNQEEVDNIIDSDSEGTGDENSDHTMNESQAQNRLI